MRSRPGCVLSCLVIFLAGAVPAAAATLTFSFSFTNAPGNGGVGVVRGVISGLEDNATGPATSLLVAFNDAGFGLGEYVLPDGYQASNVFTVADGKITTFDFDAPGTLNAGRCCSLSMDRLAEDAGVMAGLSNRQDSVALALALDFTFDRLTGGPGPVSIPLPAPVLMLASALAGLGWLVRRRPAVV